MINNYLTVILRSFARHRLYSLLNDLGLVLALAVAMLIYLYVRKEISKLAFVKNASLVSTLPGDRFSVEGFYPEVIRMMRITPP
jgi:hypothetical protein